MFSGKVPDKHTGPARSTSLKGISLWEGDRKFEFSRKCIVQCN